MRNVVFFLPALVLFLLFGGSKMEIKISSNAFENGGFLPKKYTCDGENISPHLKWSNIPQGTKSFAIINDDPDAPMGTWVHWVIYNIPVSVVELPDNIPPSQRLSNGAVQGKNSLGKIGYGGPCPPSGTHRYFFKIYALDKILDLPVGATKEELLRAIKGHILAEGQIYGKYSRQR